MIDKKAQGKRNKASGQRFEDRVYVDLEKDGWVVSRWMKNVSDFPGRKLVPAKPKIRMIPGQGPMLVSTWTGFPDLIAFKLCDEDIILSKINNEKIRLNYEIIGVEAKSNGHLDKEEKAKCKWLLENHVFSKILIAKKGKKRGKIEYVEFK